MYKTQKNLKHEKIEVLDYGKCGKPEQSHKATEPQRINGKTVVLYVHILHMSCIL